MLAQARHPAPTTSFHPNPVIPAQPRHSSAGWNLSETPACAGVTNRSHSRVGGNLMEAPASAGVTFLGWGDDGGLGNFAEVDALKAFCIQGLAGLP